MYQKSVGDITISTYSAISTYSIEVPDVRTDSLCAHTLHLYIICKFGHLLAQIACFGLCSIACFCLPYLLFLCKCCNLIGTLFSV